MRTDLVSRNRAYFDHRPVVMRYSRVDKLQPSEQVIFSRMGTAFAGKRILDLGVGGGRTTPYLLGISSHYVGIDLSPAMIAACQAKYPGVPFAVGDARDLSRFPAGAFDFVLFSHNGIDCIDHAGRLQALAEIRRILAPGGVFVFSTRNRHFRIPGPWNIRRLWRPPVSFTNPSQFLGKLRHYAAGIYHYLKNRLYEMYTKEYVIATSDIFNYDMLLYAISIEAQLAQLRRAGFQEIEVVGHRDPRVLRPDEYPGCQDPWLYYVCRPDFPQRRSIVPD